MRRWRSLLVVAVLLALLLTFPGSRPGSAEPLGPREGPAAFRPGSLIVRFRDSAAASVQAELLAHHKAAYVRTLYGSDVQLVAVPEGRELEIAAALSANPAVRFAEPDYVYSIFAAPNDPYYAFQWAHSRIGSAAAWDVTTGNNLIIAIIDTGVDLDHPDLAAKRVPGRTILDQGATQNDIPMDEHGHGTHVAGIAAAVTDNGIGVAGVSWGARIMPVRVLSASGSGWNSDITAGIHWARINGAKVINLSLGGPSYSQAMQDAVTQAYNAGILVVAAMGNCRVISEGCPTANPTLYPAALNNVMAVAATTINDTYAPYSQYGSHCDIAAPGGAGSSGIFSTYPRYLPLGASYVYMTGTSQATPHVAGLAALLWTLKPAFSPAQVQNVIESTAVDLGAAGWDPTYGHGRIDAAAAVHALAPLAAPPLYTIANADKDGNYTVTWGAVGGAQGYRLQEDDNPSFSSPVTRYQGTATQFSVSNQGPGLWYYRVQALNDYNTSPWSGTQSTGVVPGAPVLYAISNPAPTDAYQVSWSAVAGASGYVLEESSNTTFTSTVIRYMGSSTFYAVTGQPGGTWYYRVRAYNVVGNGAFSNPQSTSVAVAPLNAPQLNPISNLDGDGDYAVTWGLVARATSYTLEESANPWFVAPRVVYQGSGQVYSVTEQSGGTWHYRVRAHNADGSSPWSLTESVVVVSYAYLPLVMR